MAPAALLCLIVGCHRGGNPTGSNQPRTAVPRRVVALGRLDPAGGVISISAVPGERLLAYCPGVAEGNTVHAGGQLAKVASYDLRQSQLEAADLKLKLAKTQHEQQLAAAKAQLEQAQAAKAQADAKFRETQSQQLQLDNLKEASSIAEDNYKDLQRLHSSDPELVTEQQLRRRGNELQKALNDYHAVAATLPAALTVAQKSVEAAEANVKLAQQNLEMAEKVDQTAAAEVERKVAEQSLDQSILQAPHVEGGSTEFRVLKIMVQPGELIAQIPVLQIGDVSHMVAVAEVYEADAKEIAVGQAATIRSAAFAGKYSDGAVGSPGGIHGKVTYVGTMVASPGLTNRNPLAPSDRSVVEVRVDIDPKDKEATAEAASRIGLQVTVEFGERPGAAASK